VVWRRAGHRRNSALLTHNRSCHGDSECDSHFHWWPRPIFDRLCNRKGFPRAIVNNRGGYSYLRKATDKTPLNSWAEWFDLDRQLEYMDTLGHQVDVVCSIGPFSIYFSDLSPDEGRDAAIEWNEYMAGAQRQYPNRVWASAAVPLTDTRIAIEVLNHAVERLGLMGVNVPGSIGDDPRIDAARLELLRSRPGTGHSDVPASDRRCVCRDSGRL